MENVVQTTATPRLELIQMADMVAREKGIERDEVLEAMEKAIERAGRQKYGVDHDIRANIDRKNGQISLHRYREIVELREEVEDDMTQITLRDAHLFDEALGVGDFLTEELPPIDLGRIAAQSAKQVIVQEVRSAERKKRTRNSRTARARSSPALSSVLSTATSTSTSAGPRPFCAVMS